MMQKKSLLLAICAVFLVATGCETIKGFGKDVENTGNNIQDIVAEFEKGQS